ncbi:MAG: hypothetical protein M1825_003646 [Sarcosagium campestre]|nr:MAG: hypothetical protein M1825_003646 [Sarcosagium campestre]
MEDGAVTMGDQGPVKAAQEAEMPTDGKVESIGSEHPPVALEVTTSSAVADEALNKLSRKRTKTGCLTCRRRRIKCGEERPICTNCVKSKRHCEGYNQRVVFKDPMNPFRNSVPAPPHHISPLGSGAQHLAMPPPRPQSHPYEIQTSTSYSGQSSFPNIAPRPTYQHQYSAQHDSPTGTSRSRIDSHFGFPGSTPITPVTPVTPGTPLTPKHQQNEQRSLITDPYHLRDQPEPPSASAFPYQTSLWTKRDDAVQEGTDPMHHYGSMNNAVVGSEDHRQREGAGRNSSFSGQVSVSAYEKHGHGLQGHTGKSRPDSVVTPIQTEPVWSHPFGYTPREIGRGHYEARVPSAPASRPEDEQPMYALPTPTSATPSKSPTGGAVNVNDTLEDDTPYDIDTDEEMDLEASKYPTETSNQNPLRHGGELGVIVAFQAGQDQRAVRSFTSSLNEPNLLATYRPSPSSSPLMNPTTARIFCHFITSTGPSISMYERYPANPSVMFTQGPVPRSQQNLWTFTLPTLALTSPPLMHSILAISSLHIAKLQGGTMVPALKHYHMAIRRVARYVSIPSKRTEIATLAATLLLGFYEVMANEHVKWNSHLLGARQLLREIDIAGISRRIYAWRRREAREQKSKTVYQGLPSSERDMLERASTAVESGSDDYLVKLFMGRSARPGSSAGVAGGGLLDDSTEALGPEPSPQEVENYELLSDMFWWYAKQDIYQSILSGNSLLHAYDHWGACPPRAAMGRQDAPYGTYDHLVLIIARLSTFTAKDRRRKLKAMEANGGMWRPPPGMSPPGAPPPGAAAAMGKGPGGIPSGAGSSGPPPPSGSPIQPPAGSMMYGMIPPTKPAEIHSAFQDRRYVSPSDSAHDDIELEAATVDAEQEWRDIKQAMQVFEESLGPAFQPLPPEYTQALSTPFGPARYYKTYPIACIWANLNMAYIILHRAHPSMPPAAMMAAGIGARQTKWHAEEIGRISAGIVPVHSGTQINPAVGAAMIEISMCLFFAGVQYQDAAQRGWTISKLRDIASGSGWETSAAVASGCETSWERAGQMGRGPPYTRTMNPMSTDDRIAGRRPNAQTGPPTDNTDRRCIKVNAGTRVHWAIGILGVEEDLNKLDLDDPADKSEVKNRRDDG